MRLEISCQDRLGITQDVLDILVGHQIDLRGIEIGDRKIFLNFPTLQFADLQHLMPKMRRIVGIDDVKTIPFMPQERGQHQMKALLQSLPDPVISVDTKGKVLLCNEAACALLGCDANQIRGEVIGELIRGFNIVRWLEGKDVAALAHRVRFADQDYLADMMPVTVPDQDGQTILAGALLILKSEYRLGQQLTVFHQTHADSFATVQSNSNVMRKIVREAKRMAELEGPILLFGETGTGKELIARACHAASRRADADFMVLTCASLPDDVAETELFGHAPGEFGQSDAKIGLLEQASGGTLFLDEVGDMSVQLQAKLLRVLQDGSFRRVGDTQEVKVDVRIICTTQKDLGQLVQDGHFRQDLYYRLNVLSLVLPPLRERKNDIISLAETFLKQHSQKLGCRLPRMSKACIDYLQSYPWPGNVRQLENALYRALSLLEGNEIGKEHIQVPDCATSPSVVTHEFSGSLEQAVKGFEKNLLQRLYPAYPSTRQLAKKLGLSHTAIANKLREYGINKKSLKI